MNERILTHLRLCDNFMKQRVFKIKCLSLSCQKKATKKLLKSCYTKYKNEQKKEGGVLKWPKAIQVNNNAS